MATESSKYENHVRYKSGTGHGSQRTYLMINPLKMMSKNKVLASQMRSVSNTEAEHALIQLEDSFQQASGRNIVK